MKKILIIEDDSFLSEMYATRLNQAGYQIEIADDGQEGWQKIQDTNPDLVLLDVVLPKLDGFELLKKIKDSQFDKIPVILLTNLGQKTDVEKGLKLGAHSYIIKAHFTPAAVVAKIKEVFKK